MPEVDLPASFDLWPEADQFEYLKNAKSKKECKRLLFAYLDIPEDPDDLSWSDEWPTLAHAAREMYLEHHPDGRTTEADLQPEATDDAEANGEANDEANDEADGGPDAVVLVCHDCGYRKRYETQYNLPATERANHGKAGHVGGQKEGDRCEDVVVYVAGEEPAADGDDPTGLDALFDGGDDE